MVSEFCLITLKCQEIPLFEERLTQVLRTHTTDIPIKCIQQLRNSLPRHWWLWRALFPPLPSHSWEESSHYNCV